MNRKRTSLFLVVAVAAGCRGVEGELEKPHSHALFPQNRTSEWYPAPGGPGGADPVPINPELIRRGDGEGPESYDILLEPEDTLELFSRWTKRSVADLLRPNPVAKDHGLVAGEMFHLLLTPGEFARFSGARTAYLAKARIRQEAGLEVVSIVKHEVAEGETLRTLMTRYPTSLDLLEKLNPTLRLTGIRAKQVLTIPIVAGAPKDTPAMPGPRPPAPSPVPQPPAAPRPVIAAPEAAVQAPAALPVAAPAPAAKATTPASVKSPAPADPSAVYVVQSGDTAWVVAHKKLKIKVDELAAANPGVDLDRLRPGQKLKRP